MWREVEWGTENSSIERRLLPKAVCTEDTLVMALTICLTGRFSNFECVPLFGYKHTN